MHFRYPGTYTLLFYMMHCAGGRVTSTHSVTSCRASCSPLPTPLSRTYWQRRYAPQYRPENPPVMFSSASDDQFPLGPLKRPRFTLLLRALFNAAELQLHHERTGGGVASPVSVLTRGSVRGAPFL